MVADNVLCCFGHYGSHTMGVIQHSCQFANITMPRFTTVGTLFGDLV